MEDMRNSGKLISSKWILPIIILISVAMVCMTVLIITFRVEIKEYLVKAKTEKEAKSLEEKKKSKRYLQFSKEEKTRLLAKQGLTSITERQIGNIPFAWLGKSLPVPLPKWCKTIEKPYLESVSLIWQKWGYDGFYMCNLKEGEVILGHQFSELVIFTRKGEIRHLRWILKLESKHSTSDNTFLILKKEYEALGYEYAKKFGIPIEDVYEIDKGYEDNEEEAFKYNRGNAHRTYKAKEGEVDIILEYEHIKIDYSLDVKKEFTKKK